MTEAGHAHATFTYDYFCLFHPSYKVTLLSHQLDGKHCLGLHQLGAGPGCCTEETELFIT